MSSARCWRLAFLVVGGFLPAIPPANAAIAPEPQIVRISYVQGDVRISRGKENERATGNTWEVAEANLPLESGFNLVTGPTGRAEIEFEDTSTVYLAENSALGFNELRTYQDVPYTELALLSGMATLHVHLAAAGELFVLRTPTNAMTLKYPEDSYVRVNSFLDGMRVTPLANMMAYQPGSTEAKEMAKGASFSYGTSGQIAAPGPTDAAALAQWDGWVSDRVTSRSVAMASAMKASGLASPIPGLADMYGAGKFFSCEPYGTCWEPNEMPGQQTGDLHDIPQVSAATPQQPAQTGTSAKPRRRRSIASDDFPCSPLRFRAVFGAWEPYDWALCHSGSWIYRGHRYTWVAGHKMHHHCPVRWIKADKTLAYVPIHPNDVRGKLPINAQHGVFAISDRDKVVELISLNSESGMRVLKTAPKDFRSVDSPLLARADEPLVQAHRIEGNGPGVREAPVKLTYSPKSQSFRVMGESRTGSGNTAGVRAINSSLGSIQGRSGGGSGGFSGGSGHSSGGGFSGGGGFHGGGTSSGGGGSSAGGGASHGGGGPR
jgi:FecR protein